MRTTLAWRVSRRALQDWWDDNRLRLAASLAFYTALSLAPLVVLVVGLAGMMLDRQQVASQRAAQLEGLMGSAGRKLVNNRLTTPGSIRGMDPWYDVEYDALHEGAPDFVLTAPCPAALALLMAGILLVV